MKYGERPGEKKEDYYYEAFMEKTAGNAACSYDGVFFNSLRQ